MFCDTHWREGLGGKTMVSLVVPNILYKDTYLQSLKEFHNEGRDLNIGYNEISNDFSSFIKRINDDEIGINLAPGWVPATVLWLVDSDSLVGWLSIRHYLTQQLRMYGGHIGYEIKPSMRNKGYGKKILALGLLETEKIGLKNVLITCDIDNIGSKKIIEYNGGKLEDMVEVPGVVGKRMRYWIDI